MQARPAPTGGIFDETGKPARRFIDIVYGRALFDAKEGLTWVAKEGEQLRNAEHGTIRFQSWIRKEDNALVAAFMVFHGHRLWLATDGAPEIEHGIHPLYTVRATGGADRIRVLRGSNARVWINPPASTPSDVEETH